MSRKKTKELSCKAPQGTLQICYRAKGPLAPPITNSQEACRLSFVQKMVTQDREHLSVLHFDIRHRLIGTEVIAVGSLNGVDSHPREILKGALLNNSAAIMMVHNHPSGDPNPSRQDIEFTKRINDAAKILDIRLLDHLVAAREGCVSLSDRGYL